MSRGAQVSALTDTAGSRKEHLLDTAATLFGEKGFDGASIRDIAVAAGVNIGSIYNFFGDKRGLHTAVVERAYARLHSHVENVDLSHADPEHNLRNLLGAVGRFFQDQPLAHRVILLEMMANSEHMEVAIERHLGATRARLIGVLEDGMRKGAFRKVDAAVFSFGLINAAFSFFTSRSLFLKLFSDQAREFEDNLPFPLFETVIEGLRMPK